MIQHFVGIDPGLTGAIVSLFGDGRLCWAYRTPIITAGKGGREFDLPAMRRLLIEGKHSPPDDTLVGIEKVHTFPRDGRVGAFNFGRGYGMWLGLLAGLRIGHIEITPQRWQATLLAGLPRGPHIKVSAVKAAKGLWPNIPIVAKADWGMADAALIAEYTRRQFLQTKR